MSCLVTEVHISCLSIKFCCDRAINTRDRNLSDPQIDNMYIKMTTPDISIHLETLDFCCFLGGRVFWLYARKALDHGFDFIIVLEKKLFYD